MSRLASRATALRIVTGWLTGEVRELIGRVFRTGKRLRAAGLLLAQAFLHRSPEPLAQASQDAAGHAEAAAVEAASVSVSGMTTVPKPRPMAPAQWTRRTPAGTLPRPMLTVC
ncbi:hypothetical protein GCM10010384_09810 [Streptomyces djakartensis]|uniref:Transposase n=1 Tax=Streptomyces djakartensis TaxID=68193 RepID=A0ABQ2Z922_9ACTN|nr:hypothetical protein GCM10010384_09810 [Streptomyces djakartensis]